MQKKNLRKIHYLKFFKKALFLLLPLYVLWYLYIEFFPMYYNQPTNTRWYFMIKQLNGEVKIPDVDILFLGESRVNAAIDFTKFKNSYSFASGGATPVEMYYVLKKYLKRYKTPKVVFLSISPRFLCETFSFWQYAVRNDFFTSDEISEIIDNYSINENDTTLGSCLTWKYYLHKLNCITYYQSDVYRNKGFGAYSKNSKLVSQILIMKGGRPHPGLKNSCSDLNYETRYTKFTPAPILDLYFDKIIDLCKKNKIDFRFYFMPMNKSSFTKLNSNFVSGYMSYIKKYQEKYPEFKISDTLYHMDDKYFGDASHLNLKGKNIFTQQILEKLQKKRLSITDSLN